jgi:hypothetical protein
MLLKHNTTNANNTTTTTNTTTSTPSIGKRGGRSYRGGSYNSGTTYNEYVNGSGDSQYNRVFDQGGVNDARQSNLLIGAQGQWAQPTNAPTAQNLSLIQSAGRRGRGRKSKRGGFWGQVINQAAAPLALLGMQQTFRRKKHGYHANTRRSL